MSLQCGLYYAPIFAGSCDMLSLLSAEYKRYNVIVRLEFVIVHTRGVGT